MPERTFVQFHLRIVEAVLGVEHDEHPLIELTKKLLQGVLEVDVAAVVVILEVFEEVDEDVRVALVNDPVGLLEELVKLQLGVGQQIGEEFCKKRDLE